MSRRPDRAAATATETAPAFDTRRPAASRPAASGSPLDLELESLRIEEASGVTRRFARQGLRTFYTAEGGSGTGDLVRLGDDALLNVLNLVQPRSARWRYVTDEPLIMLRASLCCDVTFRIDGLAVMVFNRPEVTMACLPAGRALDVDIVGGSRQQGIVAVFRASTFAARHGLRDEDLPAAVRDAMAHSGALGRIATFPLDHRIAGLVADTIDSRLEGEMRVVQYSGRLAELVAYTLSAMESTPALRGSARLRRRDVEIAQLALNRLEREYRRPPLFADLAREIGTNQNKLKAVFKDTYGSTMAEYCIERRMREAQQLLLEASMSIAQVAERVGTSTRAASPPPSARSSRCRRASTRSTGRRSACHRRRQCQKCEAAATARDREPAGRGSSVRSPKSFVRARTRARATRLKVATAHPAQRPTRGACSNDEE